MIVDILFLVYEQSLRPEVQAIIKLKRTLWSPPSSKCPITALEAAGVTKNSFSYKGASSVEMLTALEMYMVNYKNM